MFVYSRKAHYHETDQMGVVHHANYPKWMEEARVAFLDSLGMSYRAMEEAGVDFSLHIYREGKHGLSTADAMAYPTDDLPRISWDVPGWLEACVRFFEEIGLTITDKR